jgi:hypothetical protein
VNGAANWTVVVVGNGAPGSYNLTGLLPNTTYKYQVRTKCSLSPLTWSSFSAILTFAMPLRFAEAELANIAVFPNPSFGSVSITTGGIAGALTVYDGPGRIVMQTDLTNGVATLNGLPAGVLTYKFVGDNGIARNGRFVVVRP